MWYSRSVTSTWMLSKCRMGVHPGCLQENFSYFERKTLMESLLAHLCRMIVFHRLTWLFRRRNRQFIPRSGATREGAQQVVSMPGGISNAREKVRKLVFLGPKNSGKTSWSATFRRIMPVDKIVSVTTGGQFSAGMIRNETESKFLVQLGCN